jgi:lysophospholipase L1-like esterase
MVTRLTCTLLLLLLVAGLAATRPIPDAAVWAPAIAEFERQDIANPSEPGGTVFVGSSSILLWHTLADDLPYLKPIQRGFGGSCLSDVRYYLDTLVIKHKPARVIIYAGANDIAGGRPADETFTDMLQIARRLKKELPDTELYIMGLKPAPVRRGSWEEFQKFNKFARQLAKEFKRVTYIDNWDDMFDKDGKVNMDLFAADKLHLSEKGYAHWTKKIRKVIPEEEIAKESKRRKKKSTPDEAPPGEESTDAAPAPSTQESEPSN